MIASVGGNWQVRASQPGPLETPPFISLIHSQVQLWKPGLVWPEGSTFAVSTSASGVISCYFFTISRQWLYLSINVCYHHSCFSFLSWGHLGGFFSFFTSPVAVSQGRSVKIPHAWKSYWMFWKIWKCSLSDWPAFKWSAIRVLLQCTKLMWGVWIVRLMNSN